MSKYQYDVTVIGGGSAGLVAARVTAALGARTLLVDKETLGGDCLHYGCVPSKALIHAAKLVQTARQALELSEDGPADHFKVDMGKVSRRIKQVIEEVGHTEDAYVKDVTVKFGKAEFKSAHELTLDGQSITSQSFIVATGSRPNIPALEGLAEAGYLTNESVFDLTQLPASLVVVGGGPIGVELAQALVRLGSRVTLVHGPERLLPREDPEVSEAVETALREDGVEILKGARLQKAQRQGDRKVLEVRQGDQTRQLEAAEILLAVGRRPNLEDLNLTAAGIAYNENGITVNEYLQTSAENIFAVGDVIGGYLFTHVAAAEAGVAARNAILPVGRKKMDYAVVPWVTFTDPEAARVGLTAQEAEQHHGKVTVLRFPWSHIDRAQAEGETAGFIKLILDEKGQTIYGAHLVGAHAGEVLAEVTLAMQHKLGISGILATIHAYPTLATGLQNAAFEAYLASASLDSARKFLKPVLSLRG